MPTVGIIRSPVGAIALPDKYFCGTAVVLEQSAQPLAAEDGRSIGRSMVARSREEEQIGFPLVVAVIVIMFQKL
jgi:hypothetical protein